MNTFIENLQFWKRDEIRMNRMLKKAYEMNECLDLQETIYNSNLSFGDSTHFLGLVYSSCDEDTRRWLHMRTITNGLSSILGERIVPTPASELGTQIS